ncbi:MAG: phosphoribosylaminoimidazole-succinocarboxamide synthase [Bacteroidia bacterium]|nr:MAG: phosphoribosylaminoimidazole-succinocarboxamide synthase [Bacteroidia bacterium]
MHALMNTNFNFPHQTAFYKGKVRDVYTIQDKFLVMIASDRISAFDVVLPRGIPYKGQVLNQIASHFLKMTKEIVPNWLLDSPHPNVSIGLKCQPFKIEMVVRNYLVGHLARWYNAGNRIICGVHLPDGLKEFDKLPHPIITPTTKAEQGHDLDISPKEIIEQKLATEEQYEQLEQYSLQLFAKGQKYARTRNLILADTKYEFGLYEGKIYLMDEVHTPDSSRYFYLDTYEESLRKREQPKQLSKEFVRQWLIENNFMGKEGQQIPEMTDAKVQEISERYIELYEQVMGEKFVKTDYTNIEEEIYNAVLNSLKQISVNV